jgi:ABC-type antimicrobial peptide transport system permease subunit
MLRLLKLVSLRHFRLSPLRTCLTVLGVAVGVAVTVAIAGVNRSVLEAFRSMVDTVSGKADLTVAQSKSRFDDALLEK